MDKLKEKIFGLVVVIALGVIFIPMLFEQSAEQSIPEAKRPVIEQHADQLLEKPAVITELKQQDPQAPIQQAPIQQANDKSASFHSTLSVAAQEEKVNVVQEAKENAAQEAKIAPVTKQIEKPIIKESSLKEVPAIDNKGWVLQMGAFAEIDRARGLIKRLKTAGYPAYSREIQRDSRILTVVLVGPYVRKEDTMKLKTTLESRFDVSGVIVHYETR